MENDKRPILCGTDFSATAIEAADIAAGLAKRMETSLVVVHVNSLSAIAKVDPAFFEAALSKQNMELEGETARLRKFGITVKEEMRSGSAFDELINAATKFEARLIVVGAIGHGLAHRLLVGSVAERTAGTSPVPVLVVRPGSKLNSWILGKNPLKILVGYDFSAAGDAALCWIRELHATGGCEIHVLHINWPPDDARRLNYEEPLPLSKNPDEVQKSLERDLAQRAGRFLPLENVKLTVEPGWGRTEGYLYEMAHRWGADLVVVGSHRRHALDRLRFGSVSRAVLHHATVSVAVIPPKENEGSSHGE